MTRVPFAAKVLQLVVAFASPLAWGLLLWLGREWQHSGQQRALVRRLHHRT